MKKIVVGLAAALAGSVACAQTTAVVYGIADAGVSINNNGVNGSTGALQNGVMSGSRWGVRGTEDLGGGMSAIFNLEQAISLDTGAASSYAGQPGSTTTYTGFNRRSFVGLKSNWGTLMLGRDYTPFFRTAIATDNFKLGLYGSNLNQIFLNGRSAENLHRASNGVYYDSPTFNGITLRAVGSLGAERAAEPHDAERLYAVGGDYIAGPLLVSIGYQHVQRLNAAGTDTSPRKDFIAGANYNFGQFTLGGGYAQVDAPGSSNKAKQYWFGGTINVGIGSVISQFSRMEFDVAGPGVKPRGETFGLAYTYPFSRLTTGYVSYGKVRNNATSSLTLFGAAAQVAAGAAGADPSGFTVGMRKLF
jgi:predicted porin